MQRSKDFRRVFANALGLRFGDADAFLLFGVNDPGPPETIEMEVEVAMTPRMLKVLSGNLAEAVRFYEQQFGEIPLPAGKVRSIEDMLASGDVTIKTEQIQKPE